MRAIDGGMMGLYDMLLPESPYVFYDNDRGYCINTADVLTLITQSSVTGHWIYKERREPIYDISGVKTWGIKYQCDKCGFIHTVIEDFGHYEFCPKCGAYMRNTVETTRDIVHQAIDNSVWSDTVDIAKMHKAVDDKYAEVEHETD